MSNSKWILLAEDNVNDADLALRALAANQAPGLVLVARDGAEALDCLYRRGAFAERVAGPPTVVMLDLKMPKVDGLEALQQIKADPQLKHIPVVMFTSSREETDVARSYDLGANAYVVKPVDFKQYLIFVKEIRRFWLVVNEAPRQFTDPAAPRVAQLAAVA
jgi:CheY-like chemotaxis protein